MQQQLTQSTMEKCCNAIKTWMNVNQLKLNEEKTDIWKGFPTRKDKY